MVLLIMYIKYTVNKINQASNQLLPWVGSFSEDALEQSRNVNIIFPFAWTHAVESLF